MRPSPSRSAWSKAWRAWHNNGRVEQVLWIYLNLRSIWCQLPSFIDLHVFKLYLHVNLHIQHTKHVFPVFIRPPRSSLAVPHRWGFHPTPRGCTKGESWRDANQKGAVTPDVCCKGITVIECHTSFFSVTFVFHVCPFRMNQHHDPIACCKNPSMQAV